MEALDWLVIGVFFLALIGIIVWVVRQKQNDSADYFLGGRDATWLAIGASIFASNIGSEHLIGLAGAGASSGMAMAHWEIQGWMILILGWVFVPFYTRIMVYTMPEFLERRYNPQYQRIVGYRLFLDCCHRAGGIDRTLYDLRRYEIGALYFRSSNPYPIVGFINHTCPRF